MTIQVEDGTGLVDANSYLSVVDADLYFSNRNILDWVGVSSTSFNYYTDDDKAVALIQATDYIDVRWDSVLLSTRLTNLQSLAFPRVVFTDQDGFTISGIPVTLEKATAEYALRALTTSLMPDLISDESGSQIIRKKEKVAIIEEEVEYALGGGRTNKSYPAADKLMLSLIRSSARAIRA